MQNGAEITRLGTPDTMSAYHNFDCINLPGRIYDIKALGYEVKDRPVDLPSGKRVKAYRIEA
jgi:hypothetical protein